MKRRDLLKSYGKALSVGALLSVEINEGTNVNDFMDRNCANYVLNTRDYLNPQATEDINIGQFTEEFAWEKDEMNGLYNTVDSVQRSVRRKRGDCKDYSAVAASWVLQHTNKRPKIVLYAPSEVAYGHINVQAGGTVYDVGGVYRQTKPEKLVESSDLFVLYKREI